MLMNVRIAVRVIIVNNNLMEINMGNAFAVKAIMKIIKVIYVNNVKNFG